MKKYTEAELQQHLRSQYPVEDSSCDWKEMKNLKNSVRHGLINLIRSAAGGQKYAFKDDTCVKETAVITPDNWMEWVV